MSPGILREDALPGVGQVVVIPPSRGVETPIHLYLDGRPLGRLEIANGVRVLYTEPNSPLHAALGMAAGESARPLPYVRRDWPPELAMDELCRELEDMREPTEAGVPEEPKVRPAAW